MITSYMKSYRDLHQTYPKIFSGRLDLDTADRIACLVDQTRARSLLDWGSGKGYQYLRDRIHERWGGILPHCYDIGVIQLHDKPEGTFDGVICTDVLEHIKPADVEEVLVELMRYARRFVYMGICCRLAGKHFLDGTNVHLTVRPPAWWRDQVAAAWTRVGRSDLYVWTDFEYHSDHDLQFQGVGGDGSDDGGDLQGEVVAGG